MSRIGNKAIKLQSGVSAKIENGTINITGPKGTLVRQVPKGIEIEQKDGELSFKYSNPELNAKQGLIRALVANMVKGTTEGFSKKLVLQGVGYKAQVNGDTLELSLGYSHVVKMKIPAGISVSCPTITEIVVSGTDKELVGQYSANIRGKREVEPYHAYGIHYDGERVIRKVGKTAGKGKK